MWQQLLNVIVLSFTICFLSGCIGAHTNMYKPVSPMEAQIFAKVNFKVYPDDVRGALDSYRDTVVAWAGIISNYDVIHHDENIEIIISLEHHYYDWLEDYSIQKEKIFLSPKGEGSFKTSLFFKAGSPVDEITKAFSKGDLVIAYGIPQSIDDDGVIVIKGLYPRVIKKMWYRTDVLEYGRL